MDDVTTIRERLESRFAAGWPASVCVPDPWLPHLAELDAQLAAIEPGYELAQVKVKFGTLRYYIEEPYETPCCDAWHKAHPLPDPAGEEAEDAWNAAAEAHEVDPGHVEARRAHEERFEKMRALIGDAEVASGRW